MNANIRVTFDMAFATSGKCKTTVSFTLPEHPEIPVPEKLKAVIVGEIRMLCNAMGAAEKQLFREESK